MYIIAGLGNPGRQYEKTRHNIGFDTVDRLADKYGISITENKYKALIGKGIIDGKKVILVKPQTFMNLSGESLGEITRFFNIDVTSELIVVFDDISLAPGNIRVRKKGSAGGHNGIKSIISHLGTTEFQRVKVGVGEKPAGWNLADHVLGHMSAEERKNAESAMDDACEAIRLMLQDDIAEAMNRFNAKKV